MSTSLKISRVLIANRGEIATRIQRACAALGIATVSVASEVDQSLLYARRAEKLVILPGTSPRDTYLNVARLLDIARDQNCDAVHPGYGFLSENAQFARAVIDAGLQFIGPPPHAIDTLGSKTAARSAVTARGVPCTPGTAGNLTDEELIDAVAAIGFPVIIKAVAGGGGRGMRIVHSAEQMRTELPRARAEAVKNFSNDAVYAERYIERPRHVEVQVFGDMHGKVIHLGTRDCSTQRRHQKLVEEAPAPFLESGMREEIHKAAVEAARSVGYYNAGTAEFLVERDRFYFLEMNTRIQVEHPVTEVVTGIDLVQLQIRVAQGEPIPFSQEDVRLQGHAIEFRVYAEDPGAHFAPSKGRIRRYSQPQASWVREDGAYEAGDDISLYYDAMLSKIIVSGRDREEAIRRSIEHLSQTVIEGPQTTLPFHRWLLTLSRFRRGPLDIGALEREFSSECLEALAASQVSDPHHRPPINGAHFIEKLEVIVEPGKPAVPIEVVHEAGGTFLARPVTTGPLSPRRARRSNGFATAVTALIEEVLKKEDSTPLS